MEKTLDNNGQNDGKQVDSGGCKVVWLITFSRIVKMEYEAIIEAENITEATKLFEKNPFAHVPVGETMGKIVPDKDDVWIERTEVIDYKGQKSPYGCSKK